MGVSYIEGDMIAGLPWVWVCPWCRQSWAYMDTGTSFPSCTCGVQVFTRGHSVAAEYAVINCGGFKIRIEPSWA